MYRVCFIVHSELARRRRHVPYVRTASLATHQASTPADWRERGGQGGGTDGVMTMRERRRMHSVRAKRSAPRYQTASYDLGGHAHLRHA